MYRLRESPSGCRRSNLSLYNIWRLAHGLGLTAADLMQELPTRKGKH